MKTIYLIPGLGADESVFHDYQFPGFEKVVIGWIEPGKGESLNTYAKRLTSQITDENPFIAGVSFGGMIAVELGNAIPNSTIFLVSSVSSYQQISSLKRSLAASGIIKLLPGWLLTKPNWLLYWAFGVKNLNYKKQLSSIIRNTSPDFLRWAIGAIGRWKGQSNGRELIRIHGDQDRILPLKGKVDLIIAEGGHFMVVDKAMEIENLLLPLI